MSRKIRVDRLVGLVFLVAAVLVAIIFFLNVIFIPVFATGIELILGKMIIYSYAGQSIITTEMTQHVNFIWEMQQEMLNDENRLVVFMASSPVYIWLPMWLFTMYIPIGVCKLAKRILV